MVFLRFAVTDRQRQRADPEPTFEPVRDQYRQQGGRKAYICRPEPITPIADARLPMAAAQRVYDPASKYPKLQ